jgi:hypothetical protein
MSLTGMALMESSDAGARPPLGQESFEIDTILD